MSETIWIKHSGLGAVSEVPASSLPQWRQSGWDLLTDDELAAREQAAVNERESAEAWMQEIAGNARDVEAPPPAPAPPVPSSEDAAGRQTEEENG